MYYYVSKKEERLVVTREEDIVEEISFDYLYGQKSIYKIKKWLRNYINSRHPAAKHEKMKMKYSPEAEKAIEFISTTPLPYTQ